MSLSPPTRLQTDGTKSAHRIPLQHPFNPQPSLHACVHPRPPPNHQNRQHSVTGEWSFAFGGGFVSPIVILVNPLIVVAHPGAVFTSSPVFPSPPPPPTKKEKKKDDDKKDDDKKDDDKKGDDKQEGKGWWATVYDEHGHRYWEHTVTKKATYIDPYY